jgi:hypothetical protein
MKKKPKFTPLVKSEVYTGKIIVDIKFRKNSKWIIKKRV